MSGSMQSMRTEQHSYQIHEIIFLQQSRHTQIMNWNFHVK